MEEQHGSMAAIHRHHPDLGVAGLSLRSYLHSIRILCKPAGDAMARHTTARITRPEGKQPGKVRGVSMFVPDAMTAAKREMSGDIHCLSVMPQG